jgi:hypothetical protein
MTSSLGAPSTGAEPPAPFRTRIQVHRPIDPTRFNGKVVVEWANVTGQSDGPTAWFSSHEHLMREGYGYVSVSAQEAGVCRTGLPVPVALPVEVCTPVSLKGSNPARYGSLHHPGDAYSADIFSQAVAAVRGPAAGPSLFGAPVRTVLALGESQSAGLMDQYLCNGADGAKVIDGLLSDADLGATISCTPRVPVIQLWSEESSHPVASTEGDNLRVWMVPGASHIDRWSLQYVVAILSNNLGIPPGRSSDDFHQYAGRYGEEGLVAGATSAVCAPDGNEYPRRYAVDAAIEALARWVDAGVPAPTVPSVSFTPLASGGSFTLATAFNRDAHGNVIGGLRSPVLDVPVATYIGTTCVLLGQSIPFDPLTLQQLYGSHAGYIEQLRASAEQQVAAGLLLPADAEDLLRRACASPVAGGAVAGAVCPRITARSPYAPVAALLAPAAAPPPSGVARAVAPPVPTRRTLPATGGADASTIAGALAVAGLALRHLRRRSV